MDDSKSLPLQAAVLEKKLNTLIFVVLDSKYPSLQEKVTKLMEAGLTTGEIAAIVAKPSNQISAALRRGKTRG
jgi:hypothetical protein